MNKEPLAEKILVMVVGPTAVGKSTVMNRVVELDSQFGRVSGFTTRDKRSSDEVGLYRYVSRQEAERIIGSDQLVQYALNPANDQVYGTEQNDYTDTFNMKDTLSTAVENFMKLPFERHMVVSLTVAVESWLQWLNERHPKGSPERKTRLQEAKRSIEWSLAQHKNHSWIVNDPHDVTTAATSLISAVRSNGSADIPDQPRKMLAAIDDLLSYE